MVGKIGLPSAAASAVSGLRRASEQIDRAAVTVAEAGIALSDTVSISSGAREDPAPDAVSALIDMRMARYNAAAQVAVLRTVDEVSSDVLGIIGRKHG